VVLREEERGEVDLPGELDETLERAASRIERRRPWLDVGHVLESTFDRLEQFGLFGRRPEEDPRRVHEPRMMTDIAARIARERTFSLKLPRLVDRDVSPNWASWCSAGGLIRPRTALAARDPFPGT